MSSVFKKGYVFLHLPFFIFCQTYFGLLPEINKKTMENINIERKTYFGRMHIGKFAQ
jgi:amino acid permease